MALALRIDVVKIPLSSTSATTMTRLFCGFCVCTAVTFAQANPVVKIAEVAHPDLGEISGIARSSEPGVFWVHNDSGDLPRLFAIRADGSVRLPNYLKISNPDATEADWPGLTVHGASHVDWEDIAVEDGVIHIGDVGNNGNARRDLGVYVMNEPDIGETYTARALRFEPIRYPDQRTFPGTVWHFDCEAMFTDRGVRFFLTKHRQPGQHGMWESGVKLYRQDEHPTDREADLQLVGSREDVMLATGADLSPSGEWLAVVTYRKLWVFERPSAGDDWLAGTAYAVDLDGAQVKQVEAVVWEDDESMLLVNEQREIFRVARRDLAHESSD